MAVTKKSLIGTTKSAKSTAKPANLKNRAAANKLASTKQTASKVLAAVVVAPVVVH